MSDRPLRSITGGGHRPVQNKAQSDSETRGGHRPRSSDESKPLRPPPGAGQASSGSSDSSGRSKPTDSDK